MFEDRLRQIAESRRCGGDIQITGKRMCDIFERMDELDRIVRDLASIEPMDVYGRRRYCNICLASQFEMDDEKLFQHEEDCIWLYALRWVLEN